MEQEQQEPKPIKRKIWVTYKEDKLWHVTKASGFYPVEVAFSPEDLRVFLKENDDVEPVLTYASKI